uniref:Uncharacterized protein n=1 Tax=Anguilla anguilla TaxID=7936 RepID=A0A0E9U199_ANGAN
MNKKNYFISESFHYCQALNWLS